MQRGRYPRFRPEWGRLLPVVGLRPSLECYCGGGEDTKESCMIKNLNDREELALRDFLAKVAQRFGGNYLYSLMFGSKARGDAHEGSDLDVAVVMQKADFETKRAIYAIAYDELLENEVDISPVIFSLDVFERQKAAHFPLLREIERDMVPL